MKKRLKSLVCIWLVAIILVGMLPVSAAAGSSTQQPNAWIWTGTVPLREASEGEISSGLFSDEAHVSINSETPLNQQQLAAIPEGTDLLSWVRWEMGGSGGVFAAGPKTYAADAVVPATDLDGDYIFEPVFSNVQIVAQPEAENDFKPAVKVYDVSNDTTPNAYAWRAAAVENEPGLAYQWYKQTQAEIDWQFPQPSAQEASGGEVLQRSAIVLYGDESDGTLTGDDNEPIMLSLELESGDTLTVTPTGTDDVGIFRVLRQTLMLSSGFAADGTYSVTNDTSVAAQYAVIITSDSRETFSATVDVTAAVPVAGRTSASLLKGDVGAAPLTEGSTYLCKVSYDSYPGEGAVAEANYVYTAWSAPVVYHTHCICGATHKPVGDHTAEEKKTFTTVSSYDDLVEAAANGGDYYLANDIALTSTINVASGKTLNLCLNGYKITPADDFTGKAIYVNGAFNLTDCGTTGAITGFTNTGRAAGVHIYLGSFTMYDGTISGNETTDNGGGVYNQKYFTMYGGTISGNQAKLGGGVYNWGDAYIYGGTIENNTATENGGGLYHYSYAKSLLLSGKPTISGNNVYLGIDPTIDENFALTIDENFAPATAIAITTAEFGRFAIAADGANIPDISVYAEKFTSDGNFPIYTQENALYIGYKITKEPDAENNYKVSVNSTDGVSYQWLELKEGDIPVTDQAFGNGGMAHGTYDSLSGCWSPYVYSVFSGYFAIPMNAGETITVVFTAEPDEEPFLFGQYSYEYADRTKDGNTYVFTAPESDTYMLLVPAVAQPTLKATKYGVGYLPIGGQSEAQLNTDSLPTGTYVCKATWNMGTSVDTSDDYTLTSASVEYTAPAPVPAPGGYDSTYPVVENKGEDPDGTVKLSSNYSTPGSTVTVAVTPDKYYGVEKVIVRDASGKEIETTKNADGTYSFKMPSGKVTVEAVYVWENPFVDVEEETFYIDAVEWALKNGITQGTSETTFSPVASCTRAQMVTFLWRAAGCPEPKTNLSSFTDIDADSYYAKAVLWALENGITSGTSKTAFSPDMECSRAQMAAFLCRMADGKAESDVNAFADVKPDAYYADSVQWAVENGITSGTGAGKYSPDATCTRGQMVTFMYRYYA